MNEADVRDALSPFKDIAVRSIERIEGGWSSHTFEVNGELIFRFARFDVVARNIRTEIAVLPFVQDHVPFRVPLPEWTGDFAGRPFVGYRMIPGRPAEPEDLGRYGERLVRDLAEAIVRLHSVPTDGAAPLLGDRGRKEWWHREYERVHERVRRDVLPLLDDDVSAAIERGFDVFLAISERPSRVVHRDLGIDHVLLDADGRITGLIDFEFVAVGDPAIDFVGLRIDFGPDACRRAVDAYELDLGPRFDERLNFYVFMGAVHAIRYGLETRDEELVAGAKRTTRERLVWAGLLDD